MRAIEIAAPGGPEQLRLADAPDPAPRARRSAGQGRRRRGQPPRRAPAHGRLSAAARRQRHPRPRNRRHRRRGRGRGRRHLIGTRVCALVAGGGYAEYCVAPAGTCLPVPEVLRLTEAAAFPETLFTVWVNLFERGFAADGDTVLVHGGTSGIGTMAIKLGTLFGLDVIVTCGSDDKCAAARALGAAHAINYRTADFVEEVKALTGGKGVAVVLDMVGGDYVPRNLAAWPTTAATSRSPSSAAPTAEVSIPDIMRRRLTLTGSTLRARSIDFKTMVADELARTVWPYVEGNRLKPAMDQAFPLAEAAAAHARMEAGDHVGKIVLTMDPRLTVPGPFIDWFVDWSIRAGNDRRPALAVLRELIRKGRRHGGFRSWQSAVAASLAAQQAGRRRPRHRAGDAGDAHHALRCRFLRPVRAAQRARHRAPRPRLRARTGQ